MTELLSASSESTAAVAATDTGGDPVEAIRPQVLAIARAAKVASRVLATLPRARKDAALHAMADALVASAAEIVAANAIDLERGRAAGLAPGLLDRLALDPERIAGIAAALRELAALPDPVGEVVRGSTLPNGLRLRQLRVPMGVVGMIYEARPNVTVDAAGLALKSGNAVILRGGSVQSIDRFGRAGGVALMQARGVVDVLVPRGGADLIQTVIRESSVPVIETGVGNCHVYVDAAAELDMALAITMNSKTHRVGVCNAAETLLVHAHIAETFLPVVLRSLAEAGVVLHGDQQTAGLAPHGVDVIPATDEDWAKEYLALEMAVRVVPDIDAAIEHIRTWSSGHTEAIVTSDLTAAHRFVTELDSAAIMVNASTRFTDGGQFGLGAEIGISTQKLHARGPMGLAELTTTTWVVYGNGQVRA